MASSMRDELASLKIERRGGTVKPTHRKAIRPAVEIDRGSFGLRLLSLLLWVIPLSLLGAGGFFGYRQYQQIRAKPEVSVGVVQSMTSGEAEKLLSAKGYLKSRTQSSVGAKVAGRVESLFAEEGSKVVKGQILAMLEHNDLDAQLQSRTAMATRARADVEEARSDVDFKRAKADRAKRLQVKSMSVSVEEMQQSTSAVDMAIAHLGSLEASLKYQEAQIKEVEESLRNMKIVAPFDGTIVEKPADVGELISGSVMTIADLDHMDVETDVAENLLSRITLGQPAEVSVSAVPSKHYRGRLRQIIPISDRARGTVKVKVEILDSDEHLFPELVATVHFLPDRAHQGLDVGKAHLFAPKSALFEEGGHSHVWLLDSKNSVRKTMVEVVVTNDDMARVESGLKAGDSIILNPAKTLHEGESVKVAD